MAQRVSSGDEPAVGRVLDGQFRLEELVGAGSMARVFRAHQLGVGRDVAVKLLRSEHLQREDVVARFRAEAALTARLSHPHVVAVHGVSQSWSEPTPTSEPYVVLEWLDGPSLSSALKAAGGRLPLERALHIVLALSDAVGEAHTHALVHRDLKPDNVLLVRRGDDVDFVKLLDFGLAKSLEQNANSRTRAGSILGTPRYVSPEGAEGQAVTFASDCYALATILFECLTGRTPFEAESAIALLAMQATATPPDIRSFDATRALPTAIAEHIMANLDKRPSARSSTARAFGRELAERTREAGLDTMQIGVSPTLFGTRNVPRIVAPVSAPQSSPTPASELAAATRADAEGTASEPTAARADAEGSAESDVARVSKRRRPRSRLRPLGLIAACFLVGALAAAAIAATQETKTPSEATP